MTYSSLNEVDSDSDDPPVLPISNPIPAAPSLSQQPRCMTHAATKDSLVSKCRKFIVSSAASARSFMTKATLPAKRASNAYGAPLRTPAAQWLSNRRLDERHGSIPTPKIRLEFFQHGGNADTAFQAKATPDTGSSQSLFGHNFIEKYSLNIDDSAKARAQTLYNASGDLMPLLGVIDIQVKYGDKICFKDGLVTESYLASPLISWHDLALLGICVLPEGNALCNLCSSSSA